VTRILAALFALLLIGSAAAQPVDYILECTTTDDVTDDVTVEIIGLVSFVDNTYRVAVLEGATCEGTLSLAETDLEVEVAIAGDLTTITITDPNAGEEADAPLVEVVQVPQVALDGMMGAAENRAAAGERRGQGEETAAEKRAERQPEQVLPEAAGGRP
jgi:hypothetical protein